jgi:hypothetical protein
MKCILDDDSPEDEYDPAFVARVLAADAEPIEASFDNIEDLLAWLESP